MSMKRWSKERAWQWWNSQNWPVGVNYVPTDAVNDIEMWMDASFNASLIEKELSLAAGLGINSVRVFLSYTVWYHERERFLNNFETFLSIAAGIGVSVMPVLFDDCAFDFGREPQYGAQPEPVPGVHNSRWVPSPGFEVQDDPNETEHCERYVREVIGAHREDPRILVWDLYNEPGNTGRFEKALPLLEKAFGWARECEPVQPLTAGVWHHANNEAVEKYCAEASDVISLHAYTPFERTCELLERYQKQDRPLLITEWMHRPAGNTILTHLPLFHEKKIGVWQWGMLVGKTQTNLSWSTMNGGKPDREPVLWQHDLLYADGTPYDQAETGLIAELTGKGK